MSAFIRWLGGPTEWFYFNNYMQPVLLDVNIAILAGIREFRDKYKPRFASQQSNGG